MPAESEMSKCIRPHGLVQLQTFSFYVHTKTDINSLAAQVDPSTNGANVYSLNFPPADKNGFFAFTQNGGIASISRNAALDYSTRDQAGPVQYSC